MYLDDLKNLINNNNTNEIIILLEKELKIYKSNSHNVDHVYLEKFSIDNNKKKNLYPIKDKDNKIVKIK